MKKDNFSKKQKKKKINHCQFRYGLVSLMLCLCIVFTSVSFMMSATAVTSAGDTVKAADKDAVAEAADEKAVSEKADKGTDSSQTEVSGGLTAAKGAQTADDAGALTSAKAKNRKTYATGDGPMTGASEARLYTDRSGNIGVSSEGYTDSTANVDVHATDLEVNLGNHTSNAMERTGGTLYLEREHYDDLLHTAFLYYSNEQAWDGKAPIRVTGENHNINVQAVENDFMLENNYGEGANKIYHPNFPIKFDHINYRSQLVSQNFWARGNKMVFGEDFETVDNSIAGDPPIFRIFGGAEHQTVFTTEPKTIYPTNVVVESGDWQEVFGGGRANTAYGTNVTVRGDADIEYLAGGGDDEGQIAVYDQDDTNGDASLKGVGANVYVEDGNVTTLYGGSRITPTSSLDILELNKKKLNVYTPVNVNVSGGKVTNLYGMSDFTTFTSANSTTTDYIRGSFIHADSTVNISAEDSADYVVGDLFRNFPVSSANQRHVLGTTRTNITASNAFERLNYFDVINITGSDVVVSSNEVIGGAMTDSTITSYGPDFSGYVGQIAVKNGAKLVLDNRGIINNYYSNPNEGNSRYQETDRAIVANNYDDGYCLSHGFVGETSEERRSLSTVSINGNTAGITAASASSFNDQTDVCGLLIHGTVQGSLGSSSDFGRTAGYSTLEVTGTPKYSDANNYYYYIVADSSVNGGKAFKEPDGADYIVCYRYLDGGKIGWYLRERPSLSVNNKLVRAGDSANGNTVMSVTMNGLGYEWSSTQAQNHTDFKITKTVGTDSSATTTNDSVSLAAMAGIKTDSSGRFANVVTQTENGVEYLVSFDYVIDNSSPTDPTYYTVEADYHVVRESESYDDIRKGTDADGARCVYDFAGNDNLHSNGGYTDSVMTTFPYSTAPAGRDNAMLRVYLPYGMSGSLNIAENDNHFRFTTDTSTDAQLDSYTAVTSNYSTASGSYANSHFGVTIGGSDLSDGVSKTLSSTVSEYICTVYSYKNLSTYDISQLTANGIKLNMTVSGLTKGGNTVGTGNPSAVNNGELQIRTAGTYKITYHFNTRNHGAQVFVVKGNLADATFDSNGQITDEFVLANAPYESNYGENLNWNASNITRTYTNGVMTVDLAASQSNKLVSLNYRFTASGPYSTPVMVPVGANRDNNDEVAALTIDDPTFKYWEIRKSSESTAPVIARCYDAEFNYCIMDDYWIAPVFESASGGSKSARLNPDAVKENNESWLAWTYNEGEAGTLVFPSDDLTFSGLKDKVNFIRLPKGTTVLGDNWSNVWNQSQDLDVQDGKTYVLTSYSQTYGDKTMYGEWTDTITLIHKANTRNRWTDSEGNLSENGRSDYLYADFEIAYKDGEAYAVSGNDSCRTGVVFELCGLLGEGKSFAPDTYKFRSDQAALKAAVLSGASSYTTDGKTRLIQCNDISTSDLTNMNRVALAKSYFNTPSNSKAVMKVTAYLVDSENNVTLSNSVYICFKDTSLMNLAISAD